jgi:MFS family permease
MADLSTLPSIAHLIQLSVAPVFLLTGVGSILGVLAGRVGRIVDRARKLENDLPNMATPKHPEIHLELRRLSGRARLMYWSISLCTICALLVCTMIALLFIGDFVPVGMSTTVALLFVAAMLSLILGLLCFLREVYLAIRNLRIELR